MNVNEVGTMPQLDTGEPIWTVDTWIVKPEREAHFLRNCGALGPGKMTVYRDVEKVSFFWSPAKWDNRGALDEWRTSDRYNAGLALLADDVLEHKTHLMESVPEFPPK
jgi:hypothetical protein